MPTDRLSLRLKLVLGVVLTASTSLAADAGAPSTAKSAAPTTTAPSATEGRRAAREPDAPDDSEGTGQPHRHDANGDGTFQAPEDGAAEDPRVPAGELDVLIVDGSGKPLPNTLVTLGILYNSVAKGESRKRVVSTTNESGIARFEHLEPGSGVAYRPMVIAEGATFEVMPFRLPERSGMRAILHVYPVVDSLENAVVVMQTILYAEVKDDRVQVQEGFKIYNLGKNAWVPKDLIVPLPENFTAFATSQGMTDIAVEAVPAKGVRIRGTFGPGQHMLEFRWQVPYTGDARISFDVGMPPHTAAARVIAPASKDMALEVPGFPKPQSSSDGQGQRALITERQLRRDEDALKSISVVISGLPTEGPGKIVATLLSAGGLLVGVVLGTKKPERRDRDKERTRLLESLAELERAVQAGDVGPKTYERARRELLDAIARTFADDAASLSKPSRQHARA